MTPSRRQLLAGVGALGLLGFVGVLHSTGYLSVLIRLFGDPQYLVETVERYDEAGLLVLFALQITNILVALLPGQAIGVAYGLLYGPYWGTVYAMVGTAIGSSAGILIAKRWGRPIVLSVVGRRRFEKYEALTESADVYPFVVLMILPVIPDDVVNLCAGLTTIDTKRLIVWLVAARFPGMITLTWFGGAVASANYLVLGAIAAVVIVVSGWVIWKWQWIMDTVARDGSTDDGATSE